MLLEPELLLAHLLALGPRDVLEWELLDRLRPLGAPRPEDNLELFRLHFLLYHGLFRLKRHLDERAAPWSLELESVRIRLIPRISSRPTDLTAPVAPEAMGLKTSDPLEAYYLDLSHLDSMTESQLEALLDSFWKAWGALPSQPEDLEVLGFATMPTVSELKARFRNLMLQLHPDQGGTAPQAARLSTAYQNLLAFLKI